MLVWQGLLLEHRLDGDAGCWQVIGLPQASGTGADRQGPRQGRFFAVIRQRISHIVDGDFHSFVVIS